MTGISVESIATGRQARALADVAKERDRQEEKGARKRAEGIDWRSCADPEMAGGDFTRYAVLAEEVGEVARALLEGTFEGVEHDLRAELVQVAAVSVAWIEYLDEKAAMGVQAAAR